MSQTYSTGDLYDLADRPSDDDRVGVALPDWSSIQPCAILSPDTARKLGAQLLLAADELDAIQSAAFGLATAQFAGPSPEEEATPPAGGEFRVVPDHLFGPAVIRRGALIDNCPSVESAERIAAALNELASPGAGDWALPAVDALQGLETQRVIRALARMGFS